MINPLNELSAVYLQQIAEETPEEQAARVTQIVKAIRYRARKSGEPLSKAYNDYIGSVNVTTTDKQQVKQKLGLVAGSGNQDDGGLALKQRPEVVTKEELTTEAKVDKLKPEHERATARDKRYDNPTGALELGGGVRRARRIAHRERDTLNKDAKDIRRGKTGGPQFQGKTGAERIAQVKREKRMKESFSNWRTDLIEVIDSSYDITSSKPKTDSKSMEKIKDKNVNNKVVINPPMREAFEEIGGTIIEAVEITEISAQLAHTASMKADEVARKARIAGDKETASKKVQQAARIYKGVGPRRAKERMATEAVNEPTADYQKAKKLNSPESPIGGQRPPKSMDPRKKGKIDSLTGLPEEVESVDEKFSMAADPSKRESPRPTFKAQDSKKMKLRSKAIKAVGTQRRQDKETGVTEEVLSERPYQITGPHSYTSGDGDPRDDVRIKNTATNVGKPMKSRVRARNKAERMNQEYGASVYRVHKVDEDIDYTVESAVEFFMNEGINEEGLEIFIEELGLEGFVEFVGELAEETLLSEARAAKRRTGGKSYEQVKAEIDAREKAKAEKKAAAKPAPKAAVATAKAKQPTKKPVRDAIARGVFRAVDAYKKGMDRHNMAMSTAKKAASVAGKGASEFGKGFASGVKGGVKFAKDVKKAVSEDKRFSNWRDDFKAQEYEFIDLIKPEPLVTEASFEIDPKKHREEVKAKKIRDRTKTGDEGSEIAKKKVKGPKLMGEKLNLKKADMGEVIDDFYGSDAPQFKGKSKKKRREMAIAAKLGAEGDDIGEEYKNIDRKTGLMAKQAAKAGITAGSARGASGEIKRGGVRNAVRRKLGLKPKERKSKTADALEAKSKNELRRAGTIAGVLQTHKPGDAQDIADYNKRRGIAKKRVELEKSYQKEG